MTDPNSSLGSNEDRGFSASQNREDHGGARPRHQNFSGTRGNHHNHQQPQHRVRTYYNAHRSVEGNYRHYDHPEQPDADHGSVNSSQHYRGSRRRPFKHNQFGTHHSKRQDRNSKQFEPSENDSLDKSSFSNIQEDLSVLSVVDQKQGFNSNHTDHGVDKSYNSRGNRKPGGFKNRGRHAYRSNRNDDLSLLKGVEEKQSWNDSSNSRTNFIQEQGNHRQAYNNFDKNYHSRSYDQNSQPHVSEGHDNYKSRNEYTGDYEQFRWYGRRNYNAYGKQGSYRPYEEPVHDQVVNHYASDDPQRTHYQQQQQQHRQHRPYTGFHHNDRRQPGTHRHHKSKANSSSRAEVEDDDATQRERLLQQIKAGELECMVCCECVRHRDPVWSCLNCFHIFHLNCIQKWARSPTAVVEGLGWRCPACQSVNDKVPNQYFCYCGKVRDPERSYHDTPHSCGNVCGRKQADEGCVHSCTSLCHPGPCPPCAAIVKTPCQCGKVQTQLRCGKSKSFTCEETCGKDLNCHVHKCVEKCHTGPCQPCSVIVKQECYCSKVSRDVACTETTSKSAQYSCDQTCNKVLACGEHSCDQICHNGPCFSCRLLPENVVTCPCGRSKVTDLLKGANRKTCTEPIPTCDNTCLKVLLCGPADDRHACQEYCHSGACPPCPLKTNLRCRCGATSKDFFCTELSDSLEFLCEKRCNKKKRCGRHKCLNTCCVDYDHLCLQVCNQKMTCGLHTCQDLCHNGKCKPCLDASFEELPCRCGHTIKYPPVPCGAKPPDCDQPCTREHPCDHPPQHNCHSEDQCPPCTVLSEKWCHGGHEKRSHLPCFLPGLSCGLPCQKPLSCGQHNCLQICHQGACEVESSVCSQPCTLKRTECEHPCSAPCHTGKPCPETSCKKLINMSCICGTRTEKIPCSENKRLFRQMSASLLASKMQHIQSGASVDISDVLGTQRKNKLNKLDCNDECSLVERNRRLALALQIRNPDLSSKPGPPAYTEFLKDETRRNPTVVKSIHDKMTDLVQLAKQSKQKSRSHSFPPMNRDQRRVIHEMSEFFGCETESFDQEPKRNVVVTAFRDKSFLPSCSVMSVIQREMGQRKAPAPVIHLAKDSIASSKPSSTSRDSIDYFDFPQ